MSTLTDRPIFVVGSPRSGTTLLRAILDAHSALLAPPWETGAFICLAPMLNGDLPKILKLMPGFPMQREDFIAWLRHSVDDLFARVAPATGKRRWVEKTPLHVLHIPLICETYPQAQFIHIIRNGYEVVRSLQNMHWAPRQIRWSTQTWIDAVQTGRRDGTPLGPGQYMEVRYEQLTREPEPVIRQVCEFLQEPFEPGLLNYHQQPNNIWGEKRDAIQDKPVNKHRDLGLVQRWVFRSLAGPLMRELGYPL